MTSGSVGRVEHVEAPRTSVTTTAPATRTAETEGRPSTQYMRPPASRNNGRQSLLHNFFSNVNRIMKTEAGVLARSQRASEGQQSKNLAEATEQSTKSFEKQCQEDAVKLKDQRGDEAKAQDRKHQTDVALARTDAREATQTAFASRMRNGLSVPSVKMSADGVAQPVQMDWSLLKTFSAKSA